MRSGPPIVVTGLGAITPLGLDVGSTWAALREGRTGTRALEHDWFLEHRDSFATGIGAPVQGFDLTERGFEARDLKTLDRTSCLAIAAAKEALEHAGFTLTRAEEKSTRYRVEGADPTRFATIVGTGVGGLTSFEMVHRQWLDHRTFQGAAWMRYGLSMLIPNAPAANVAIRFGLRGECTASPTACAAGTMSIGDAFRLLSAGEADVALAGGTDGVLSDLDGLGLIGFDVLRVMSTANDRPESASRPFERDRDGFVLGEGAAVLVLETEDHARARGATPLARIHSYASTCDAHSMMQPEPSGREVLRAMTLALERAGVSPSDIAYVNAHGTGTPVGDRVEAAAIRTLFGDGSDAPLVSATKSMTGHCIGASGAIEAIATILAIDRGEVHRTANLRHVGEGCELRHVVGETATLDVPLALTASYGFGGHDAVLVLGRP